MRVFIDFILMAVAMTMLVIIAIRWLEMVQ